jgi:hypothetical protein
MRGRLVILTLLGSLVAVNQLDGSSNPSQFTLDLTTPVAENQQGRSDMPGGEANWRTGQSSNRFQLPLSVHILKSWADDTGNITVEILLRNTGVSSFDIPISRDISRVEQTASKSRSLFFLRAVPVYDQKLGSDSIGLGQTAGSLSIQDSLMRLKPGDCLRVLIPVTPADLKRSLPKNSDRVKIRIICEQWHLDDQRYFIASTSDQVLSVNSIVVGFQDGTDGRPRGKSGE